MCVLSVCERGLRRGLRACKKMCVCVCVSVCSCVCMCVHAGVFESCGDVYAPAIRCECVC